MELCEKIIKNQLFKKTLKKTKKAEKHRIFCRHGIEHLLDTARIAYILSLENSLDIDKDIIYAAALLHDCGRFKQYEDSTPHEEAGAVIARQILEQIDCEQTTAELIINAVAEHRKGHCTSNLSRIIFEADKASRMCLFCKAEKECNHSKTKKNMKIIY
ncbi:MAG: HD domain-containing protein [Oscillospiraceae bacterium]|nr:HD domain-containing protein [Oscillospiraceae bacterium]